ncbi:hypothetical protein FRB95_012429 [Tulasnella sp. JGI-2019a]|nr:hypothetical protein FRB95_012429 [Tulasnella sp. JGI-2019a]
MITEGKDPSNEPQFPIDPTLGSNSPSIRQAISHQQGLNVDCNECKRSNIPCDRKLPCRSCLEKDTAVRCGHAEAFRYTKSAFDCFSYLKNICLWFSAAPGSQDSQNRPFSLFDDLTHIEFEPFPATQATINTIRRLAGAACTARRNCQTIFSLVSAARGVCHKIHNLIHECYDARLSEDYRWMAFDCFDTMLEGLESILDGCSDILEDESANLDVNLQSWSKNRAVLRRSLAALHASPFESDEPNTSMRLSACNSVADNRASALSAFGMLVSLKNTVYGIPYEPDIFETLVRLASSIYLLLGTRSDAENEETVSKSIQETYPVVFQAVESGDLSRLAGVWLRLEEIDTTPARHLTLVPPVRASADRERQSKGDITRGHESPSALPSPTPPLYQVPLSLRPSMDTIPSLGTNPDPEARVASLQTGESRNLDQDIGHYREVSFSNLAAGLQTQFGQTGDRSDLDRSDLDRSIGYPQEALSLRPVRHPDRVTSLVGLATGLRTRFKQIGDTDDRDQSIEYLQEALSLWPVGHPHRAMLLSSLATSLQMRFKQTEGRGDLNQSIKHGQEVLSLRPVGHSDRVTSLVRQAAGLQMRFEQTGDRSDLDQSIEYGEEALSLRPIGHPERAISLTNLAAGLLMRFEKTGNGSDLDQAIEYSQEALSLRPVGHPNRAVSLTNLAAGLHIRFGQAEDSIALDQSIRHGQEALSLRPIGHPDRITSLVNLAAGLQARYQGTGTRSDLN